MSKNPFYNAVVALGYIVSVVTVIFYGSFIFGDEETILIPMAMLSLFVFSASLMGYVFLYQPLALYFDGKKAEAAQLFLATVGYFGALMAMLFLAAFLLR